MYEFLKRLNEFELCAKAVWASYQTVGPGRVDQALFTPVETAAAALGQLLDHREAATQAGETIESVAGAQPLHLGDNWTDELLQVVTKTHALAYRCACRPEGLCFVSGETGLIPRNDEHAAFEDALAYLSDLRTRLSGC